MKPHQNRPSNSRILAGYQILDFTLNPGKFNTYCKYYTIKNIIFIIVFVCRTSVMHEGYSQVRYSEYFSLRSSTNYARKLALTAPCLGQGIAPNAGECTKWIKHTKYIGRVELYIKKIHNLFSICSSHLWITLKNLTIHTITPSLTLFNFFHKTYGEFKFGHNIGRVYRAI